MTLGNLDVMPAQAPRGIHDFSSASFTWIVKSWIPAFAGMTSLVVKAYGFWCKLLTQRESKAWMAWAASLFI